MYRKHHRLRLAAVVLVVGLLALPSVGQSPAVTGQATAVQATAFGFLGTSTTTILGSTGTLASTSDARDASQAAGSVPSLLTGEVLHATTIGWPDQVSSEASLANLGLNVAGLGISADFVMARASHVLGAAGAGAANIDNLSINGVPIAVTGQPNQTIAIPGGRVVINEQVASPTSTTVNALHVIVIGVSDVVIASATAGIS